MSVNAERAVPSRTFRTNEVIVGFSPERLRAPFFLRCGAILIDYLIVVAIPVAGLLIGRAMGEDGAKLLSSEMNSVAWLIAILLGLTNGILLPMFNGQTVGKMLTGLRIVRLDGTHASSGTIAFRQISGLLLTAASAGIGFFLSVFSNKGRALHDYLAGTVVIYADRRVRN
jgi:uncharacterized RDD family membrane protein YckC